MSGGLSETHRFILEASNSPYDQITFEASDAGLLTGFPLSGSERYSFINGRIFSGSISNASEPVTGPQFASVAANLLLSSSIDAFKNQMILKSPEIIDDKPVEFILGNGSVSFDITNEKPFAKQEASTMKVEHVDSFFQDKRLSHIPNFQFLPPINKPELGEQIGEPLGNYVNIQQQKITTINDLKEEFKYYEKNYSKIVKILETSTHNNMIGQFFEISNGEARKLDIIDFGNFEETAEHVFFAGKVFIDDNDTKTFVHMFTLIFSGSI